MTYIIFLEALRNFNYHPNVQFYKSIFMNHLFWETVFSLSLSLFPFALSVSVSLSWVHIAYLPMGTQGSLMDLHQAKRPVIVYRSLSIGTKLICEQQLIPIKANKESSNQGVDDSISNAVCFTHTCRRIHTNRHSSYWQCLCSLHSLLVHALY